MPPETIDAAIKRSAAKLKARVRFNPSPGLEQTSEPQPAGSRPCLPCSGAAEEQNSGRLTICQNGHAVHPGQLSHVVDRRGLTQKSTAAAASVTRDPPACARPQAQTSCVVQMEPMPIPRRRNTATTATGLPPLCRYAFSCGMNAHAEGVGPAFDEVLGLPLRDHIAGDHLSKQEATTATNKTPEHSLTEPYRVTVSSSPASLGSCS